MTTYYEVVVQLLRKTCEELFNCCHVACGEKKVLDRLWVHFRGKRNKSFNYNCTCWFLRKNYLFFYLFVFILYLWINLCVYIYVFIWFIVCVLRILVQGGGRFWAKGNKATSGEALPVVHCTERTFSTFVLCTNISKWPHKKPKSQENWKKCLEGWGTLFPYY